MDNDYPQPPKGGYNSVQLCVLCASVLKEFNTEYTESTTEYHREQNPLRL